jgi:dTDP-4-dehydrorhamnose 3,5-epimerase
LKFIGADLAGAFLIEPRVILDNRGFFLESYSDKAFEAQGLSIRFVQDNHSLSRQAGVLRGLHFQVPPSAQTKLVRVTRGAIYDVIVDLRRGSPTYGRWQGFELNASNFRMLLVPKGFAHGFCTLEPDTEVQYKVDCLYARELDTGLRWNDPTLAISWPFADPVLSEKDETLPFFKEFLSPF